MSGLGHNAGRSPTVLPGGGVASPHAVPEARIYRPSQARGPRRLADHWVLEFEPTDPKDLGPLTGWTGSSDPFAPVRIRFETLAAAVEHAERHGWRYRVQEPSRRQVWPAILRYEMADMLHRRSQPVRRGLLGAQRADVMGAAVRAMPKADPDPVDEALMQTFPASDPPAFTGTAVAA